MVRLLGAEAPQRRALQGDQHLGRRHRHPLAGADEERHPVPAPRIDVQPHRRVGLDRRVGGDPRLVAVALELPAHQVLGHQRANGAEHLDLLVADRLGVGPDRRLHRQQTDDLQHVVLDDVADRARLFVELAAPLDAEALGHRDLHALDEVLVPDRLEEGVGEPEDHQVLDRLLAQVVVDAEDRVLVEDGVQRPVQLARGLQVAPERLFDDQARPVRAARLTQPVDHDPEEAGRDGQVVRRPASAVQLALDGVIGLQVRVVAAHVAKPVEQLAQDGFVQLLGPVLLQAFARAILELLRRQRRVGDADDRHVQMPPAGHRVERGENLLVGEVPAGPEEYERVGPWCGHVGPI